MRAGHLSCQFGCAGSPASLSSLGVSSRGMSDDTNWNALKEERRAVVERIRALPFDAAWQEVRAALDASPSLYADNRVLTVYEGPTKSFLLPLPFELLRD